MAMSGTPCQIEGLVHYLRKPYDKLLLIDVVCYGIPSPGIFADYLTYMHSKIGGKFNKILFREKRNAVAKAIISTTTRDKISVFIIRCLFFLRLLSPPLRNLL